jgi:hypothetical protein
VHDHGMPVSQGERVARYDGLVRRPGGLLGARRAVGAGEGVGNLEGAKGRPRQEGHSPVRV